MSQLIADPNQDQPDAVRMSKLSRFDPDLSIVLTPDQVEKRRAEIFRDAETTAFLEWLCQENLPRLLKRMVSDIVSWFDMRENDEVGVPEFTKPSIARLYFVEGKSVGFVAMQIRKERESMYRLPLTSHDWADFVSLVNETDMRAFDKTLETVIRKTGLTERVQNGAPQKSWFRLRQQPDNSEMVRSAAELLIMVRLGFEKGRSRPDLRPGFSDFEGRDPTAYGLPALDLDLDVIGRMFVEFPPQSRIELNVRGNLEQEIRRYIKETINSLSSRQVKEFSDTQKIKNALKARGHDPATLPNYKQAIAFPKVLPIENRKIVRLEDYLEYGFGMNKLGTLTVFEEFIGQLAGVIAMEINIDFGSIERQFIRTRELVRSILGFSQHEEFVKILQRYVEQAIDQPEFGLEVARFRQEQQLEVA